MRTPRRFTSPDARARVLLSSVFKPFAQDDEYGSRAINPVELYHNQVTREQGPFSLRMFHRSWSLIRSTTWPDLCCCGARAVKLDAARPAGGSNRERSWSGGTGPSKRSS